MGIDKGLYQTASCIKQKFATYQLFISPYFSRFFFNICHGFLPSWKSSFSTTKPSIEHLRGTLTGKYRTVSASIESIFNIKFYYQNNILYNHVIPQLSCKARSIKYCFPSFNQLGKSQGLLIKSERFVPFVK